MAYFTAPKKMVHKKYGTSPGSWGNGYGTSYPGKSMPNTQDDTGRVKLDSQSGNGKSAPGTDYPKGKQQHQRFPESMPSL